MKNVANVLLPLSSRAGRVRLPVSALSVSRIATDWETKTKHNMHTRRGISSCIQDRTCGS